MVRRVEERAHESIHNEMCHLVQLRQVKVQKQSKPSLVALNE